MLAGALMCSLVNHMPFDRAEAADREYGASGVSAIREATGERGTARLSAAQERALGHGE